MQQFLEKAEGTGPATDETAKHSTEHSNGAKHKGAKIILTKLDRAAGVGEKLLEATHWAKSSG